MAKKKLKARLRALEMAVLTLQMQVADLMDCLFGPPEPPDKNAN